MAQLRIKYGHPTKILVAITNLKDREKTVDDITDVVFMLKTSLDQSDTAAPFRKTLGSGVVVLFDRLEVTVTKTDFGSKKLVANAEYIVAIGIEFNSDGIYVEQRDDRVDDTACIVPDRVRV